jgi:hypothetical protein
MDNVLQLSLYGNPTDGRNLWAEPRDTEYRADRKDLLELPLATSQHDIATNWIEANKKFGGEKYHGYSD